MSRYFSFQRMITASFVRGLYFLGFVVLTAGGLALTIWSGLGLYKATIDRTLGWRYVMVGVGALIVGNLVWRVFCELWIVLFNINDRLVSIDQGLMVETVENVPVAAALAKEPAPETRLKETYSREQPPRTAGVLGLS